MFKTIAIVLALAGSANASGFRLSEQDARANAMGNTGAAVADNPSAVWYNPAAITGLEGTNLSLGSVLVVPEMEHTSPAGATDRIKNTVHVPPHFYATRKLNDKFALGFGVLAPFGLSTEWDKDTSLTRKIATKSEIQAFYANLDVAYKVMDGLSVAAGASAVRLDATMNKKIEASVTGLISENIEQKLTGDGTGAGYNLAAKYDWRKWSFGANYHSKVKVDIDGKIKLPTTAGGLNNSGLLLNPLTAPYYVPRATDNDASTKITLPDTFEFGVARKLPNDWLVTAEADYTNWATYRRLVIDYTTDNGLAKRTIDNKNWTSTWAFRVGGEHKVNENWKLRCGAFYDVNPVKENYFETRVPDSDRLAFSFGAGYAKGSLTVDASYMYLRFMKRTIDDSIQDGTANTLNGKYSSVARLPAVTVGYKF